MIDLIKGLCRNAEAQSAQHVLNIGLAIQANTLLAQHYVGVALIAVQHHADNGGKCLYHLFRNPQEEYTAQIWEDILWIWLVQERPDLESLNQHQRIIDELRRIVHDTLLPAPWQHELGAGGIYARAAMLSSWMASPWGEAETEDILNTLVSSGTAQQFILLRIFLDIKNPISVAAPKEAFAAFAARFDIHFRECSALYDAALALSDLPLPANDSSGSTFHLNETLEECAWHL